MDKKNIPLVLGLALPLLVVLVVYFNSLKTSTSFHPQYNFLYSVNQYGIKHFTVNNKKLMMITQPGVDKLSDDKPGSNLFVYDVINQATSAVTLEEAQRYTLESSHTSPDHYLIKAEYDAIRGPVAIFFINHNSDIYLQKGKVTQSVNLANVPYWNFEFIGWILDERK